MAILDVLKDNNSHSLGDIEFKTGSNWQSVRNHIEDLEELGFVKSKSHERNDANGRAFIDVKITAKGRDYYSKVKSN